MFAIIVFFKGLYKVGEKQVLYDRELRMEKNKKNYK